jgi:putative radical SAM enzyme (TIGR03279 family)
MAKGGLIAAVHPGSVGAEVGLEPGDVLVSVNGHTLRDELDYRYYAADEDLVLVVERQGERHRLEIERDYDEELGLEFAEPVFDGMRRCANHCPFCFVQQMPKGLRPTLYLYDDDYRYSFLLGNFITFTNLSERDWQRIVEQRLSPLYVSIHATDLAVRRQVLGNAHAPDILAQLQRLDENDIQIHGQIVIWPGVNDGAVLRRSIEELVAFWPTVQTLALVPVGLTRDHDPAVRSLRP